MRRSVKIAAWTAGGLVGFIVLLIGTVLLLGNTERGRALLVRLTTQVTHGQVQLTGLRGAFPAALDLDRLALRDADGEWLFAERVSLRWSPGALLVRHLKIDTLHIGRLHIERAPVPQKEEKKSGGSSIPRSDLTDLSIGTLELGRALAGEPVSLTVKAQAHLRSLEDATAYMIARRTGGNGDYELGVHFDPARMDARLKLQEPANGPLANLLKVPGLGALSVAAQLNGSRNAEVVQLSADAGPLRARAQGTVDLVQRAADLDYSLNAPAMTPYVGLSWDTIELKGRFHGPFTTPNAQGHLLIKALRVSGSTQLDRLEADLAAQGGLLRLQSWIEGLQIPGPQPALLRDARLAVDAAVHLNDPKRPLELTARHALFSLQVNAVTAGDQHVDLTLRLPDVAPLAAVGGQKAQGDAEIQAQVQHTGTTTRFRANVDGHLNGGAAAWAGLLRDAPVRLETAGELTEAAISIDRLQLTGRALSLKANATAARTEGQDVKARFEVSLPDLKRASAALAGTLDVTGTVKGPRQHLNADVSLKTSLSAHGSPRGTITASVRARDLPSSPGGTLQARGALDGAPLHLNVELKPEGGQTYRAIIRETDWKSAHADGDITSGARIAQARGHLAIRMGNLGDLNRVLGSDFAGSVDGRLALAPLAGRSRAQLQLSAKNVVAGAVTGDARVAATGPMDALNVTLDAQSPSLGGQPVQVNTAGLLNLTAKELQLVSLEAVYHEQNIRLLSPAKIEFANGLAVHGLTIGAQEARLEVDGRLSPALDVRAAIRQLKPELINAFVPNLLASGTLSAEAQVQGRAPALQGHVQFEALGVRAKSDAALGLPAADLRANAQLLGDSTRVDARLTAGSASQVALSGRAPLGTSGAMDLKLAGNLDLGLLNPMLEAGGRHVTGELAIDTTVTGAAAAPEIAGTMRLSKGSVRDYTQGISLSDIAGELTGSHGQLRIERLTARAAPGELAIDGTIGVLQPKIPVELKLTAKNAQPIASNIVTANLDADMKVTGTAREQLDVGGKVHINRADIGIPGGLPPSVAVLDVERDGQAKTAEAQTAHPLVINLNIAVDAPRRILVKGRGLDAEMGGDLHIRGTTAAPVVEGGFELQRGFFTLANSKLTFTNGTVTFNGTGLSHKLDPSLDFTAQTKAAEITAIVHITGVADAPQIELSSTPDLPQDEILARVLFGEPAAQLSALQLVETGAALASLRGGSGGGSLNPVAKIQKALGLDRLSVGGGSSAAAGSSSQQSSGTSVEAGRYVSSRVYVGVKESTTGASQVGVDVDLTKRLKLQAKLGNGTATAQGVTPENDPGSSLGVAYQFEY
jgi:translocation and assembly module TamB